MHSLPLANILHHKLRSFLAAVGIGIGVCMLITLSGLARGSLHEVADRWESVDADLIVTPAGWGHQFSARIGSGVPDAFVDRIRIDYADTVQTVVPVFFWQQHAQRENLPPHLAGDGRCQVQIHVTLLARRQRHQHAKSG